MSPEIRDVLNSRQCTDWLTNRPRSQKVSTHILLKFLWRNLHQAYISVHSRYEIRVSVQGVKSLGGHFACLSHCSRIDLYKILFPGTFSTFPHSYILWTISICKKFWDFTENFWENSKFAKKWIFLLNFVQ